MFRKTNRGLFVMFTASLIYSAGPRLLNVDGDSPIVIAHISSSLDPKIAEIVINSAIENLYNQSILPDTIKFKYVLIDQSCGEVDTVSTALKHHFAKEPADVWLGPTCNSGMTQLGVLATVWKNMVLGYLSTGDDLANKDLYKYLARFHPPQNQLVSALVSLIRLYGWKQVAVIKLDGNPGCSFINSALESLLDVSDVHINYISRIDKSSSDISAILSQMKSKARIIIMCNGFKDVNRPEFTVGTRDVLLQAMDMGMVTSDYVYLLLQPANHYGKSPSWEIQNYDKEDPLLTRARDAFKSAIIIKPEGASEMNFVEIDKLTRKHLGKSIYDLNDVQIGQRRQFVFPITYMYDSIYMYGLALNRSLFNNKTTINISGPELIKFFNCANFDGYSGGVTLDRFADRIPSYMLESFDYDGSNSAMSLIKGYYSDCHSGTGGLQFIYKPFRKAWWATENNQPPSDVPACGFTGTNPRCFVSANWYYILLGALAFLVMLCAITGYNWKRPLEKKVKAITEMPSPKNQSEVRQLLGLVNYYRRYIPNLASITAPLNNLLRKETPFHIDAKCERAIQDIKTVLSSKPVMALPDFGEDFIIYTDASIVGLGVILAQQCDDTEKVVAYASRTLKDPEKKYGITELEALAVVWGIKHFKHYIHGTHFTVVPDHQALKWLMKSKQTNPRLGRWAIELQVYDYDIIYRKGILNTNADCLSRLPVEDTIAAVIEFPSAAQLERSQPADKGLSDILNYIENGTEPNEKNLLAHLRVEGFNYTIENGTLVHVFMQSTSKKRRMAISQIVVPEEWRKTILQTFHDDSLSGHLGFHKTYAKVRMLYYWQRMYTEIRKYCDTCMTCNLIKSSSKRHREELCPLEPSSHPFERMACDFVGPLPVTARRNKYLLVFTDYHTRYVEVIPTRDLTAETTADVLLQRIITRYSAPAELLSDRGTNFLSEVVKNVCSLFNTRKAFSTSFHPQTDGLTERFNKTLASMLKPYVFSNQNDWDLYIPFVSYAYNTSVQDSILETPFFLLYGRDPVHPNNSFFKFQRDHQNQAQWLQQMRSTWELAKANTILARERQRRNYNRRATAFDYQLGDRVFISDITVKTGHVKKLTKGYKGLFRLIQKAGPATFRVEHLNGAKPKFHDNINVSRLKPCHLVS